MKKNQLEFTTIINEAFASYERSIVAYIAVNRDKYEVFARTIAPNLESDAEVYARIAFAILSANAPFEDSVKALNVAVKRFAHSKPVKTEDIIWFKMIPAKAKYLNRLARLDLQSLRKSCAESWHEYRMRLKARVLGLGLTKASFAACLLYPLEADLACVDTWIQKVFLGNSGFKSLGIGDYLLVESKIRTYANCFGVSTFVAQWLIWDHARGSANSHAIFPGSHK